jgi:uncharacterized Zn-finger protein
MSPPNPQENVVEEPQPKKRKQLMCPECGKTVTSLATHMKTHQQTLENKCILCEKSYKTKSGLVIHLRSVHEGVKLNCAFCPPEFPRVFSSWSGRQDHYLQKHFNITSTFQCPITVCNRSFPTARILKRHMRQLHSQFSISHKCEQCDLVFTRKQNLKIHRDSKHSDKASVVCEVCNKTFSHKKLLRQHNIIHSGEKNYKCLCCDKAFGQSHVMRNHIKKLHPAYVGLLPPKGTVINSKALQRMHEEKAMEKNLVKVDVKCVKSSYNQSPT